MKKIAWTLAFAVLALAAYLSLWPVPIQAVSWKAPAVPGYIGVHAANNKLAGLNIIPLGAETGPEHIVLARDGKLYAAVASGNILRMNPDGTAQEVFANTGGRVLGFDFDAVGHLIAADAIKGLLAISPDRKITVRTPDLCLCSFRRRIPKISWNSVTNRHDIPPAPSCLFPALGFCEDTDFQHPRVRPLRVCPHRMVESRCLRSNSRSFP